MNFISKLTFTTINTIILLFTISSLFAQNGSNNWHLKVNYASVKPIILNDLWYVTSEGYHIHPRTEGYTPGFSLSIEHTVFKRNSMELMLLYGRPKAVLGIVDQNSSSEPIFEKGYNFFTILLSPNISLYTGDRGKFYISPVCGWGTTSEVSIQPAIGPEVTWNKTSEFIYGGKTGFWLNLKNEHLAFNIEFICLSLSAKIKENVTNMKLHKTFGPFGLLFGLSYTL